MYHLKKYLWMLFLLSSGAGAQDVESFIVQQQGTKVYLDFTLSAGSTCNGINILRSGNGLSFEKIGDIAGVCGSATTSTRYSFTDNDPLPNRYNYYRLDLVTLGYSDTVRIFVINTDANGLLIFPHPLVTASQVWFKKAGNETVQLLLFDQQGKQVRLVDGLREDHFFLDKGNLAAGCYTLQIVSGGSSLQTLLLVE